MALNGSGTFSRLYSWVTDRNAGTKIQAARMDAEMDGMATALSTALYRDGQAVPTANLPMGGYKLTGLGDATAATDALNRQTADARYLASSTAVADLAALLDEAVHDVVDVASASTCDIGAAASDRVRITGTTTITSLGTGVKKIRFVHFSGALILTHNATSLILPSGADITTAAGDAMIVSSDSSGNWRVLDYQRASGAPLVITAGSITATELASNAVTTAKIPDSNVTTAKIADNNVTLAKLATIADGKILANTSGGAAIPAETSLSTILDLVGSAANGDILVRSGGAWTRLAAGTSGYVVTSNGAGSAPSYQAATGTGWEKIGATTVGGAVASVEHTFTAATYSQVMVVFSDISCATGSDNIVATLRNAGGAIVTLTASVATAPAESASGWALFSIGRDAATKVSHGEMRGYGGTAGLVSAEAGGANATAADRVRLSYSVQNIDDGIITVYGLKV